MMRLLIGLVLGICVAAPVLAKTPDATMRPIARGTDTSLAVTQVAAITVQTGALSIPKKRPSARPYSLSMPVEAVRIAPTSDDIAANTAGVIMTSGMMGHTRSLRPKLRPKELEQAFFGKRRKERRALRKGAVCGDPDIQGEVVGRVPGRISGCGVQNAVKVRSVSGIGLSQKSVMDCGTAKALKSWVNKGLKPAMGRKGGGVSEIKVAAHYACRTRNNQKGAKISEHGKGRAIDISGFTMRDGSKVTVLKGWNSGSYGRALKKMHKTACGPFGTVLGPNANKFHRDHFHFDTARYRSGSYCR